jgi:hypothetical protein
MTWINVIFFLVNISFMLATLEWRRQNSLRVERLRRQYQDRLAWYKKIYEGNPPSYTRDGDRGRS